VLWTEYPGLRVDAVTPAYLFAMKAFAGRPQDIEDLESLARHLGIETARDAIGTVTAYVPDRLLTPRVRYLLDDLFAKDDERSPLSRRRLARRSRGSAAAIHPGWPWETCSTTGVVQASRVGGR
jgi:hypothetical protein